MAKTEKRGANKAKNPAEPINIKSMAFWRNLAKSTCPHVDDEYELGELALALQQTCELWSVEQKDISKICNKNEDTKICATFAVTIDRRTTPSEIAVKVSFSEKHGRTMKAQVPDPNQDELPLQSEDKSDDDKAAVEAEAAG